MRPHRVHILGTSTAFLVHIEGGVAEIRPVDEASREPDLLIELDQSTWGEVVLGITSLLQAYHSGRLVMAGEPKDLAEMSRALTTGLESQATTHTDRRRSK